MSNLVTTVRLDELPAAFRLLFAHLTQSEQDSRLDDALSLVEEGAIDPDGIFVVRDKSGLRGAQVAIPLRGAGGVLWAPAVKNGSQRSHLEDELVKAARNWLRQRGSKLAHALLYLDEARRAEPLLRNGFTRITRLQYLHLPLTRSQGDEETRRQGDRQTGRREKAEFISLSPCLPGSLSSRLTRHRFADVQVEKFQQTLQRTYEDSLDCPELDGVRTIEEIIEGHKGQGNFDPGRWWLACLDEQPAGVLLLADMPEWGSWDISYVGVVPEVRRRGIAEALIQLATAEAGSAGVGELTAAVDTRNQPAWKLYARLGFQPGEQRDVYLAVL